MIGKNEKELIEKKKNGLYITVIGSALLVLFIVLLIMYVNKYYDTNIKEFIDKGKKMTDIMVLGFISQGLLVFGLIQYFLNKSKLKNIK